MYILNAFDQGGMFMYAIAFVACFALLAAIVALVTATSRPRAQAQQVGVVAVGIALLVPVVGGVGFMVAIHSIENVLAVCDPASREQIRARGTEEAMTLIYGGFACGALPLLLAVVAVLLAARRPT